jgi:PQQ-like domain
MSRRIIRIVIAGFLIGLPASAAASAGTSRVIWFTPEAHPGSQAMLSPDASRLIVTGQLSDDATRTNAYSTAAGTRSWARAGGNAVAMNPAGTRVYVTRESVGSKFDCCYLTYAYSTVTGALRWRQSYEVPGGFADPWGIAATRKRVYVTGQSAVKSGAYYDMVTVAYASGTGRQLWVRRYRGDGPGHDVGSQILVSPSQSTIYVVGASGGGYKSWYDYVVVAYRARSGKQLWESLYDGPGHINDVPATTALTPDGSKILVSGTVDNGDEDNSHIKWGTVAFDMQSGARRWARLQDGPTSGSYDYVEGSGVSPDSRTFYVTGDSEVPFDSGQGTALTIAYDTKTGRTRWKVRTGVYGDGDGDAVVSPDSSIVYVAGSIGTRAYRASDGTLLWQSHIRAGRIFISPDGSRLYLVGAYLRGRVGVAALLAH